MDQGKFSYKIRIRRVGRGQYNVESRTERGKFYLVSLLGRVKYTCTCPAFAHGNRCWHEEAARWMSGVYSAARAARKEEAAAPPAAPTPERSATIYNGAGGRDAVWNTRVGDYLLITFYDKALGAYTTRVRSYITHEVAEEIAHPDHFLAGDDHNEAYLRAYAERAGVRHERNVAALIERAGRPAPTRSAAGMAALDEAFA